MTVVSGNHGVTFGRNVGGGFYMFNSSMDISNCMFLENRADGGGGLIIAGEYNPTIYNSVFSKNSALGSGGGISLGSATATLVNCTVADNSGGFGGGLNLQVNSSLNVYNSVISGNSREVYVSASSIVSKNSLIQGYTSQDDFGNLPGTIDPGFKNAANGDFNLFGTSQLINKGNNTLFTNLTASSMDAAGKTRLFAETIDIGAFEFSLNPDASGVIYVKKGSAGDGSSWSGAVSELSTAIAALTNNSNIKQIWVAQGEYQPALGQSFTMKEGVKIYGGICVLCHTSIFFPFGFKNSNFWHFEIPY